MEQNFQTSFIPKKPIIEERVVASRPIGLLTILAIFFLFVVLLGTGGLYFYKGVVEKSIADSKSTLDKDKDRFEPSKITELTVLDKRLQASKEILAKHISVSPIFKMLGDITMKSVRFTRFGYDVNQDNSKVLVKMSGLAVGYRSVALQSDLFSQNKNFIDPVFSNLTLDNNGNVLFDLDFSVDSSVVNYKQTLSTMRADSSVPTLPVTNSVDNIAPPVQPGSAVPTPNIPN